MNIIAQLELQLTNFEAAVQHFSQYVTGISHLHCVFQMKT